MSDDPNQFLEENAGDFAPGFKFATVGASVTGTLTRHPNVVETDDLGGGRSKKLVVDIEDGNGERWAIWLPASKAITKAVASAVKAAGAAGLAEGGTLTVTHTGVGEPSQPGYNPPKFFEATYQPPAAPTANVDDFAGF